MLSRRRANTCHAAVPFHPIKTIAATHAGTQGKTMWRSRVHATIRSARLPHRMGESRREVGCLEDHCPVSGCGDHYGRGSSRGIVRPRAEACLIQARWKFLKLFARQCNNRLRSEQPLD
jgi:hypothetical protein